MMQKEGYMRRAIINILFLFIVWVSFLDQHNKPIFVNPTAIYTIMPTTLAIIDETTDKGWFEEGSIIILNNNEHIYVRGNSRQTIKKITDALKKPQ